MEMELGQEEDGNVFSFTGTLDEYREIHTGDIWSIDAFSNSALKPTRVIYNGNTTICYWKDGTKTVVRTSENEPFVKEFGVALAIVKKLYGSRSAFLRDVEDGYDASNK